MEPSPQPHENPAKGADEKVPSGSMSRFKRLARHLFGVDQTAMQEAREKDAAERRARRGR